MEQRVLSGSRQVLLRIQCLWLDGAALLAGDMPQVLAVLQQGLATSEHAEFVRRLAAAKKS